MKDIYNAVRGLVYPRNATHQAGQHDSLEAFPFQVRRAVREFELINRGHRHRLSDDAVSTRTRADYGTSLYNLRNTISTSLEEMVQVFLDTPAEDLEPSPELDALLDARDTLGWLRAFICRKLDCYSSVALAELGSKGFQVHSSYAEPITNGAILHLHVGVPQLGVYAKRQINLPSGEFTTIRAAKTYLEKARQVIREELSSIRSWPEFTDAGRESQHVLNLREAFRKFAQGYPVEVQKVMARHWDSLCPIPREK